MSDLRDLMTGVVSDLDRATRWPSGDDLRRRVRRRQRRRAMVAVAGAVVAVTIGAAGLTGNRVEPPPPAVTPSPTVTSPVVIPPSVLLTPDEAGAGPDSQDDGVDAAQPGSFDEFTMCGSERAELMRQVPRFSRGITHLLGTEEDRPESPFVVGQQVYRFAGTDAAGFMDDVRSAVTACDTVTATGEAEVEGRVVSIEVIHSWRVTDEDFAGEESMVVRHDITTTDAETAEQIAYVRAGDLVTRIAPRTGTTPAELRELATVAGERLCTAATVSC